MRLALLLSTLSLLGCGGSTAEPPPSTPSAAATPEVEPVRVATTRVGLPPMAGLDIPNGGAPGFQSPDREVILMITEYPDGYDSALIDRALSWPPELSSAPRQTVTLPDGRPATWVCESSRDELSCALVLGDDGESASILVVAEGSGRQRMPAVERALHAAAWLAPYAPPRRFLADLAVLCRLAGETSAPAEGSWMMALLSRTEGVIVDAQLLEVMSVFSHMDPPDRMSMLVALAAAYGQQDYECPALDTALAR